MKNLYLTNWLCDYGKGLLSRKAVHTGKGPTHVMFLFVDHFELAGKTPRLSEWMQKYPYLVSKHRDSDGKPPQHTWFYALDLLREDELQQLQYLVDAGLGEMELHWHHSHDTPDSYMYKLQKGLEVFQKYGFMKPVANDKFACFGFIHGNWSLNNARGKAYCGVDSEIELLKAAGCYGDFTYPALHSKAQPNLINSIYYADFTPGTAGYFNGRKSQVGVIEAQNEFLMVGGPLTINWRDWRFAWHPMIENAEIGKSGSHGDPVRIDSWVQQRIQVQGKPEWIFVKAFCHGGQDHQHVLGAATDYMFTYLEAAYNDGVNCKLHYVTAREAYNIIKAAEEGKEGDPNQYRDYCIPPSNMR